MRGSRALDVLALCQVALRQRSDEIVVRCWRRLSWDRHLAVTEVDQILGKLSLRKEKACSFGGDTASFSPGRSRERTTRPSRIPGRLRL